MPISLRGPWKLNTVWIVPVASGAIAVVGLLVAITIVVGLVIIEAAIDIITEGATGITAGIVEAGIDIIVTEDDAATIGGAAGIAVPKVFEPDPWIGNAPAELWANAVEAKAPKDAERR